MADTEELPPIEGPTTRRFPLGNDTIKWEERIDCSDGSGHRRKRPRSYVFRANIAGKEYAIKIFAFYNPLDSRPFWGPLTLRKLPLVEAAYYFDPFFNECRAYGRVREVIEKRRASMAIVVPCYGFLLLGPDQQRAIQALDPSVDFGLSMVDPEVQRDIAGGFSVRAIVKDIEPQGPPFSGRQVPALYRGLKSLNKEGVYGAHIGKRKLRNGKLVDFSSSWTVPHQVMREFSDEKYEEEKACDMSRFDEMVQEERIRTKCIGIPEGGVETRKRRWTRMRGV